MNVQKNMELTELKPKGEKNMGKETRKLIANKGFLDACREKGVRRIPTLVTEVHKIALH